MKSEINYDELLNSWEWDADYIAEELAVEFAQNVYEVLQMKDIKKNDLANYMNVSRAHISQILNGKSNITFKTIAKISSALKVKVFSPVFKMEKPTNIYDISTSAEKKTVANSSDLIFSNQISNVV